MKYFFRTLIPGLMRTLVLMGLGVVSVSPLLFAAPVNVGDEYGGGKVVYLLQPGDQGYKAGESHGLIAAKEDLPQESLSWFEAKAAVSRMDVSGNKGWSLPNEKELSLLYQSRDVVGGFRDYSYYWSGSEVDPQKALTVDFFNGDKVISVKSGALPGIRRVRPVRKF